jgi:4-hydroxy-3-methylbut-2-enyl diphosphate reductase
MKVNIDPNSGFCFGVVKAINKAEEYLKRDEVLYCIGDIVHNNLEVERLKKEGLLTINHEEFKKLKNVRVLLRAHGEPPLTYALAKERGIEIVDASCPVVLNLQRRIRKAWEEGKAEGRQIVIYGKKGHAEVNGLVGQTDGEAIVVEGVDDLEILDYSKPIEIFSQTTKTISGFREVVEEIRKKAEAGFVENDTICRKVSNRIPELREFAKEHDFIVFVSGKKSSNGRMLYEICKQENEHTFFVQGTKDFDVDLVKDADSVGICGATSTPRWVMEEVYDKIIKKYNS